MSRRREIPTVDEFDTPDDYVGQVVKIPTGRVKTLPGQPRTYFGAAELQRLRDSIAEIGQQQPATVVPWADGTFRLRDGERRFRCCRQLGLPLIALVVEARDEEEEFELSTAANMNRESHSPLEKALAMKRLRDGKLKRSVAQIARTFGVSDQTVYNHLAVVESLPERVLELMDPNVQGDRRKTLPISAAYRLTTLKEYPAAQLRIAKQIVRDGLSVTQAIRAIDTFADTKQITEGRGRERTISDEVRVVRSNLRRVPPLIDHFCQKPQREIDEAFAWTPRESFEQFLADIEATLGAVSRLRNRVKSVQGVGAKRGAA